MPSKKIDRSTLVEIVLLPAALVLLGYLILWLADGAWWGVVVWVLIAPPVYFAAQLLLFGGKRAAGISDRRTRVVAAPGRHTSAPGRDAPTAKSKPEPAKPRWTEQQDVSAGAEILRRGRRYDRRA